MELISETACFRVSARMGLALEARAEARHMMPIQGRRLADQARGLVGTLSTRRDSQIKEALSAVLDAVAVLEREVELLHRRVFLESRGVALHDREVELGADGLWLSGVTPAERALLSNQGARVHLELPCRGGEKLLALHVEVAGWRDDAVDLVFEDPDPALVDLVVAFVFETQRKERRRELQTDVD